MKTIRWCLPLLVVFGCMSCKQSGADFTPYIQVSYFYLNPVFDGETITAAEDTLMLHFTDGVYVIDTINSGDVVAFQALYGSYSNELTAARVSFDTTQVDIYSKLSSSVQNILLPTSDVRMIQLMIAPGYNGVSFPLVYTPEISSGSFLFTMTVESDSKLSPSTVQFRQPVR